jgi:hypothetical protein
MARATSVSVAWLALHRDAEALLHHLVPVREVPHLDRIDEHRRPRPAPQFGDVGRGAVVQVPRDPRPKVHWADRAVLAALARMLPRGGRPPVDAGLVALIGQMARENPGWGYKRVQGELLDLGFRVGASTVRRVLRRLRIPPAPKRSSTTWREFLKAHSQCASQRSRPLV